MFSTKQDVYTIEVKGFSGAWVEMNDYMQIYRHVAENVALSLAVELNRDVRIRERVYPMRNSARGMIMQSEPSSDKIIATIEA
jgi:hypothetical protein